MSMSFFEKTKLNLFLKLYAMTKIPLLSYANPQFIRLEDNETELKINLNRRTRNHLNTMYFGALCMGGELVIAAKAVKAIYDNKLAVDFVFKDFQAQFLKRADGDVHFICHEGLAVEQLIKDASSSDERVNRVFKSYAYVPSKDKDHPVAEFTLTLSVKARRKPVA